MPTFIKTISAGLKNRLVWTEEFNNGVWATAGAGDVTANVVNDPADLTQTAERLRDTSGGSIYSVFQTYTGGGLLQDERYVFSVYVKPEAGNEPTFSRVYIEFRPSTVQTGFIQVDWSDLSWGTVTAGGFANIRAEIGQTSQPE